MIVVDTSVLIDHLRGVVTPQVSTLRDIIARHRDLIVIGDLVLSEILQGAASDADAALLEKTFRPFVMRSMVGHHIAITSAANYRSLRTRGVTVRRTIDMLIGTFCIESRWPLLHANRDFDHMERHLGLICVPPVAVS